LLPLFLSFRSFFAGQQSRQTKKLENSALNKFLVVNEPEEQEFSLKKIQQILRSGLRLHGIFSSCQIFFGWPTIKTNGKTQKLSSKHLVVNELEEQEFSLKKSKFQQILRNMFRANF
jgi:hypothetical protein